MTLFDDIPEIDDFQLQDLDSEELESSFNEDDFDLPEDEFSGLDLDFEIDQRYIKPPKHKLTAAKRINYTNAKQFAQGIDFDAPLTIVDVPGNFIKGDLYEAILEVTGWSLERLDIHTLSYSKDNVDSWANLMNWTNPDGSPFVDRLNIIASDYFRSHYRTSLIPYMFEKLDIGDRFQFATCRTHKKTTVMVTTCGRKIFISGSGNERSSDNIEQLIFSTLPEAADAEMAANDRILSHFFQINHEVPKVVPQNNKTGDSIFVQKSLNSDKTWAATADIEDGKERKRRVRK